MAKKLPWSFLRKASTNFSFFCLFQKIFCCKENVLSLLEQNLKIK
jgi:hypothetical protein